MVLYCTLCDGNTQDWALNPKSNDEMEENLENDKEEFENGSILMTKI
jgi:hypothetical protein